MKALLLAICFTALATAATATPEDSQPPSQILAAEAHVTAPVESVRPPETPAAGLTTVDAALIETAPEVAIGNTRFGLEWGSWKMSVLLAIGAAGLFFWTLRV